MGHTCTAALVKCMDFRLTRDIHRWLEEKGLVNDCDIISVAGASKDLVENPNGYVSTQVSLSVQLHQVRQVLLVHHLDCGAYGGSGACKDRAEEVSMHKAEMDKARAIISGRFPNLEIQTYFAVPETGGWKVGAL